MSKKRKISDEQWKTAVSICKKEGLTINDVEVVRIIYAAMSRANGRVTQHKSYKRKGIKFELGIAPVDATINVINSHHFNIVKQLQAQFEASGEDENYRIEIDRIDKDKHYSLDNINFITKADHVKKSKSEKSIPVNLVGFDTTGGLRLGNYSSKGSAKKSLKVGDDTLNKMINNTCEYKNIDDEIITFLHTEFINPAPADIEIKGSKNMDEFMNNAYQHLHVLNNLQDAKPTKQRQNQIENLVEALARCEMKLKPDGTPIY